VVLDVDRSRKRAVSRFDERHGELAMLRLARDEQVVSLPDRDAHVDDCIGIACEVIRPQ